MTVDTQTSRPVRWIEGITRYHLLVFVGCWLGGIFDGMDSTLMSVVLPSAISSLVGTASKAQMGQVASVVSGVFLLGWMVGGLAFGWVGDRLGRVRAMLLSILCYALFTGLAGLAHDWPTLAACRFLTGLGIGGEMVSIATFLTEVWPERSRAVAVGALITSYQAGVLIAGTISFFIHDWRHVFFVGALPALLVFLLRGTLDESHRWQADRARRAESNEAAVPLAALLSTEHRRNLLVGGLAFGGMLIGYWASLAWIPTWIQGLLATGSGNERSLATIYQGVAAILGCLLGGWACEAAGRKPTILLSFAGSFVASGILFLTNRAFSAAIYWENALLGLFVGMAQAAMYLYMPELFPTRVRASATGLCLNAGRLATAIAVFFVGVLVVLLGGYAKAAFTFSMAYLLAFGATLWGRETRGLALQD